MEVALVKYNAGNKTEKRPSLAFIVHVFLLSFLAYYLIDMVAYRLFSFLAMQGILIPWLGLLEGIFLLVMTACTYRLIWEKIFKLDGNQYGLKGFHLSWKWLVLAILMPTVLLFVYFKFLPGSWVVNDVPWAIQVNWITGAIFTTGFAVAFTEEVLIRGLLLGLFTQWGSRRVGLLLSSVVFALLHLTSPNLGLYGALLLFLASFLISFIFSFAYWESGTILSPILVHGIWNTLLIGGLVAVGPQVDPEALVTFVLENDHIGITGGAYGVEASFISLGVILVFLMISYFVYKRGRTVS